MKSNFIFAVAIVLLVRDANCGISEIKDWASDFFNQDYKRPPQGGFGGSYPPTGPSSGGFGSPGIGHGPDSGFSGPGFGNTGTGGFGYPSGGSGGFGYPSGGPGAYPGAGSGGFGYPSGGSGGYPVRPPFQGSGPNGCPACDSSVFSYCADKLVHDTCCCGNPSYLPASCRYTDCRFLYANSCAESNLMNRCCCRQLNSSGSQPAWVRPQDDPLHQEDEEHGDKKKREQPKKDKIPEQREQPDQEPKEEHIEQDETLSQETT